MSDGGIKRALINFRHATVSGASTKAAFRHLKIQRAISRHSQRSYEGSVNAHRRRDKRRFLSARLMGAKAGGNKKCTVFRACVFRVGKGALPLSALNCFDLLGEIFREKPDRLHALSASQAEMSTATQKKSINLFKRYSTNQNIILQLDLTVST